MRPASDPARKRDLSEDVMDPLRSRRFSVPEPRGKSDPVRPGDVPHTKRDRSRSVTSISPPSPGKLLSFVKKVRMGKRIEKAFGRDKGQASATQHDDDDPNKTPEPYVCSGHFQNDFTELCRRNQMVVIPPVVLRPHRPPSPSLQTAVDEAKSRPGKKDDKKNQPPPEPDPEPVQLDENGEPPEPPPKTYMTKSKFEFFKPAVQVEMDNPDKLDTVTEVHVKGWKVDEPMMIIFKQCWPKLERLHSITLWNSGLTNETLEILASILPECLNLRSLCMDNNPVPGEAWHLLLKEDSPVQHLSLRYNRITDKGAEGIGKALGTTLQQNHKLVSLNLNGNSITDSGCAHLAAGLRMNRTLLTLGLGNNKVADTGAKKLSEVLSRFTLTHEEIVERRKLLSSAPDRKSISPHPGQKRSDSRDRPGSVRSSHGQTKGKSAKAKKDGKGKEEEKHDKSKGKKDATDKGVKKELNRRMSIAASVVADASKSTAKKGDKGKKKAPANQEQETSLIPEQPAELPEILNPLLDQVEHLENGVLLLRGNRTLVSLNLSHNSIGEEGVKALHLAVGYQTSMADYTSQKNGGSGLMRLSLNRNPVPRDSLSLQNLCSLMLTKDPFYKPPPMSPDQESQR